MEEPRIATSEPRPDRQRAGGRRGEMTDKEVKAARYPQDGGKRPIRLRVPGTDRQGLYLQIAPPTDDAPAGTKSWLFRYASPTKVYEKGKRIGRPVDREMGLGAYPKVSLAGAAQAAKEARALLLRGIDPLDARAEAEIEKRAALNAQAAAHAAEEAAKENARRNTFAHVAGLWFDKAEGRYSTARRRVQMRNTVKLHALPVFGTKPVADIGPDDIEAMLKPIWTTKRETADRLRSYVEQILDYAHDEKLRPQDDNPARRGQVAIRKQKDRPKRKVRHQPSLPYERAPEFYRFLLLEEGAGALALRLQLLTAVRPGEAREARWGEFDLDARRWAIPASRTKTGNPHVVPLAEPVMEFLLSIRPRNAKPDALLFPSPTGRPISDMTMSATIKRMNARLDDELPRWASAEGLDIVPHGFRSTFRVYCEEATNTPRSVSEASLGHRIADNNVEGSYLRGTTLLNKRIPLMEKWVAFVTKAPAEVVQLRPAGEVRAS